MNETGKNIRRFRVALNMTQEDLAEKIRTARTTVSNYETGRTQPDIDMLVTISEIFDVTTDELIFGSGKVKTGKEKPELKKPVIILSILLIIWLFLLYRSTDGFFREGFAMYWTHIYQIYAKPVLLFSVFFAGTLIVCRAKGIRIHFRYRKQLFMAIVAGAAVYAVSALFTASVFTHWYGGDCPLAMHGAEIPAWAAGLFEKYSAIYRNTLFAVICAVLGTIAGTLNKQ